MASRVLKKEEWQLFFDQFSKQHKSSLVNLEVIGKDIGDQTEIRWQPLRGISHDPRKDTFFIITDSIEHSILHPKKLELDEMNGTLHSIQIVDHDNNHQIIRLKEQSENS